MGGFFVPNGCDSDIDGDQGADTVRWTRQILGGSSIDFVVEMVAVADAPSLSLAARDINTSRDVAATRDAVLSAVEATVGGDFETVLEDATNSFGLQDAFAAGRDACRTLRTYSAIHGGPEPCSTGDG